MGNDESIVGRRALEMARTFGSLIRKRRKALNMSQDQLALATGVGLLVANALGLRPADLLAPGGPSLSTTAPELPDLPEEVEEPDGPPSRLL